MADLHLQPIVQSPDTTKLYAALLRAQRRAPTALGKTDRNEFANFDYVSADRMVITGREVLNEEGLAIFQRATAMLPGYGASPATLRVTYRLVHESGQWIEMASETPVVVKKGTPEDKGAFGSLTENLGYTMRGLLMIGRLNAHEVDVSSRNDNDYAPSQPQAAAPPPEAPPQSAPDQGAADLARQYILQIQGAERAAQQQSADLGAILRHLEPIAQRVPGLNLPPEQFAHVRDEYNRVVTAIRGRLAA